MAAVNPKVKVKSDVELAETINKAFILIKKELSKVIIGQDDIIEQLLISLFARGHCLLIGVYHTSERKSATSA